MDLLTQATLGGVMAQSAMRAGERRLATFTGVAAGLLADADVLIRSTEDPLLTLEYHRHFTHSLVFIPVGATLVALLAWWLTRRSVSFARVWLFALLGLLLSGMLDAATSYGTHLLWPFSDERTAWSIISIVDPLFTLILLAGLLLGWRFHTARAARIALLGCVAYLAIAAMQSSRAEQAMFELADSRGHQVERHVVKPTLGNILLWRSVYRHRDTWYVDALRTGITGTSVYQGGIAWVIDPEVDQLGLPRDSVQYQDVLRFQRFSDGYLSLHPDDVDVIGDIRYSMLPDSTRPLWGIRLYSGAPGEHAVYEVFRTQDEEMRRRFIAMLLGE